MILRSGTPFLPGNNPSSTIPHGTDVPDLLESCRKVSTFWLEMMSFWVCNCLPGPVLCNVCWNHRIIESLRLEKTTKIKSNHQPITTMPTKLCPSVPHWASPQEMTFREKNTNQTIFWSLSPHASPTSGLLNLGWCSCLTSRCPLGHDLSHPCLTSGKPPVSMNSSSHNSQKTLCWAKKFFLFFFLI